MKKTKFGLLTLTLSALTLCSCNNGVYTGDLTKNAPDYSKVKATFNTFGYTPPTGGDYYEDGITISTGTDFRTPERYKEYKEAGLNILMLQNEDQYDHKPFEESTLKKRMDDIQKGGLERVIVCDTYLFSLCNAREPLVGPDNLELTISDTEKVLGGLHQFKTEDELKAYVANLIEPYRHHPVFYGVIIRDEPYRCHLPNWSLMYKTIKRIDPNIYIEGNLLPYDTTASGYCRFTSTDHKVDPSSAKYVPTKEEAKAAYKKYIEDYLDWSGASRLMMDSYPFLRSGTMHTMKESYLTGLQILGDIVAERKIEFEGVAQTFGGKISKQPKWASPSANALQWQLNSYMGLGCETFGYFTYWRKVWNVSSGEWFNDGESFISNNGTKTQLYYNMQSIHAEMQKQAPTLSCFEFKNMTTYVNGSSIVDTNYALIEERDMTLFKKSDFTSNSGSVALITELRDNKTLGKNQYMYMVQNAIDPYIKESEENPNDDGSLMKFSIKFDKTKYNAVAVMYRGETYLYALNNGVYSSSLDAGYAEYIMPYMAK